TWVYKPGYKGRMLTGTKLQVTRNTLSNGSIGYVKLLVFVEPGRRAVFHRL
ncbi:hypothetical protein PQX77_011527, partial [Marasmius sp. AFHP31]